MAKWVSESLYLSIACDGILLPLAKIKIMSEKNFLKNYQDSLNRDEEKNNELNKLIDEKVKKENDFNQSFKNYYSMQILTLFRDIKKNLENHFTIEFDNEPKVQQGKILEGSITLTPLAKSKNTIVNVNFISNPFEPNVTVSCQSKIKTAIKWDDTKLLFQDDLIEIHDINLKDKIYDYLSLYFKS